MWFKFYGVGVVLVKKFIGFVCWDFIFWDNLDYLFFIEFCNVIKCFGEFIVVDNLFLKIYEKEFFVFFGGFGCGKIILMCMLVGFEMLMFG